MEGDILSYKNNRLVNHRKTSWKYREAIRMHQLNLTDVPLKFENYMQCNLWIKDDNVVAVIGVAGVAGVAVLLCTVRVVSETDVVRQ